MSNQVTKNMKQIWPFLFAANLTEATKVDVICTWDDFKTGATFGVSFYDENNRMQGTIPVPCTDADYATYNANRANLEWPVQFAVSKIQGLELVQA